MKTATIIDWHQMGVEAKVSELPLKPLPQQFMVDLLSLIKVIN